MSDTMQLLYASQTRNVLGAVSVRSVGAVALQVTDAAGPFMSVRYILDESKAPAVLITGEAQVPISDLALATTAFDPQVVGDPRGYVLGTGDQPKAASNPVTLTKTAPDQITVTAPAGGDLQGATIFLRLSSDDGDQSKALSKLETVPVGAVVSNTAVTLTGLITGTAYTILCLVTGFRPAMTQLTFP